MKVLALVGVSCSGKTTLMEAIQKKYGEDRVEILHEATKGDICKYAGFDVKTNFKSASRNWLMAYDTLRISCQLDRETKAITQCKKDLLIIDKALPQALMYLLTLSARELNDNVAEGCRHEVVSWAEQNYNYLLHMPYGYPWQVKDPTLLRNFTGRSILQLQDAAIHKVCEWINTCKLTATGSLENNVNLFAWMFKEQACQR